MEIPQQNMPENGKFVDEKMAKRVENLSGQTGLQEDFDIIQYMPFIIAFLFLFITIALFKIKQRREKKRGILLTGLCDSGKTLLFARLIHQKYVLTQTSIKENSEKYLHQGEYVNIIDIPGHERLRNQFLGEYKAQSKAIVYVVDSQSVGKDIRDVAEYLYNILIDRTVVNCVKNVLIACNKQDQPLSKNSNAIKIMLEKEINTLRITQSNQLKYVDSSDSNDGAIFGDLDKPFSFSSIHHCKVDFVDCYATDKEKNFDIAAVKNWIERLI